MKHLRIITASGTFCILLLASACGYDGTEGRTPSLDGSTGADGSTDGTTETDGADGGSRDPGPYEARIRTDHPRLFFNADTLPAVLDNALGPNRKHLDRIKGRADAGPPKPSWSDLALPPPRPGSATETRDWGIPLMASAFVYLVEPDPQRLQKIREMLFASLDYYHASYDANKAVSWYATTRVNWLAALDWVWNELNPADRTELVEGMLDHIDDVFGKPDIQGRNIHGYKTGYYGGISTAWFAGLVFHNEGIDDYRALNYLQVGQETFSDLLAHRSAAASNNGGAASATLGYSLVSYPWAEWNFLYTWQSAINEDISSKWPYIALFPRYVIWNRLPGNLEFGYGDASHSTNEIPASWLSSLRIHMSHIMHFYGESHPEDAALAAYVLNTTDGDLDSWEWSVYPFLMTKLDRAPPPADPVLRSAQLFESMGQVFMRSGSGPDDTYAMISLGGTLEVHRHYDATHFTIYRSGFLALDTGSRVNNTDSLQNYYAQTVAHNAVLIKMLGEEPSPYWNGEVYGQAGGQYKQLGSEVVAFETSDDFTYVAGDATATYRPEKCALATRQFVFVPPEHFVVFDRVTSTDPNYEKRWLLHHANQPVINGTTWYGDQDRGRLFSRTLLPADASLRVIGGPGKEFVADGVNYPVSNDPSFEVPETMGRWRVEVVPGNPRIEDVFLHLIQVGDQGMQRMSNAQVTSGVDSESVTFDAGDRSVTIQFRRTGDLAGHIAIKRGGKTVLDRDLTKQVEK
jgi:Heparinase II/III-like protein